MSDATEPRATTPFPAEGAAAALLASVDPLAGDWSEGLRGPLRALGIAEPRLLLLDGLPQPEALKPAALPPIAPVAEIVEAPDAWGEATEDPLQSAPPPASEPPSVIITFSEPPATAPPPPFPETTPPSPSPAFEAAPEVTPATPSPAFLPDVTPASAAPAFLPDVTPATAAPAFLPDATPATAAPAFLSDATPATPAPAFLPEADEGIVELGAEDAEEAVSAAPPADPWTADSSDAAAWAGALHATPAAESPSPWSEPVAGPPPAAVEPAWKEAPLPMPAPAAAAVGAWDQVTAVAPAVAWQAPPAQVEAAPEAAVDAVWSSPPPAGAPVAEWKAEAPPGDWQELKKPEAPAIGAPPAADWGTLSSGPDWSSSAPHAGEPPQAEAWGSAPPPPAATTTWDAAPAAAGEPPAWEAAPPAAAAAPPAPSWNAAPVGASSLDQLDSEPEISPTPGAAQELFGSVPLGASLAGDEPEDLGPPEELASPEEFLKPVELSDDDADLLVPVEDDPPPPPLRTQPLAAMQPVGVGVLFVQGEHRVAVHTRGGRTRRGSVKDIDLGKSQFGLVPQGGGVEEPVYHAEVKAIFFMLSPGEKPQPASGGRVRVTFADGRTIEGSRDGAEAKHGFFLVPADAARTNTRRIYVAREATTDVKDG